MTLRPPSPSCDRNCSGRQGGGRSAPARGDIALRKTTRAAPSLAGVWSISTRCGGNELVRMLRPPTSGARSNRAESQKVRASDRAPKVSPTVAAAVIPTNHGWMDPLGHADTERRGHGDPAALGRRGSGQVNSATTGTPSLRVTRKSHGQQEPVGLLRNAVRWRGLRAHAGQACHRVHGDVGRASAEDRRVGRRVRLGGGRRGRIRRPRRPAGRGRGRAAWSWPG